MKICIDSCVQSFVKDQLGFSIAFHVVPEFDGEKSPDLSLRL